MRPLCYLNSAKSNAIEVLEAFAAGSGAEITTRLDYRPERDAVFYGVDRATFGLWNDLRADRGRYYYIDNGYFRGRSAGGDYLRISYCRPQHDGNGISDGKRWAALGFKFAPWRAAGKHILVACQTSWWHERHGEALDDWVRGVKLALARHSDRPVVVRQKPIHGRKEPPLEVQLKNCHAVIVHTSMVGAEALLAGVPVFSTYEDSCFVHVGQILLSEIERPRMTVDREHWARVLADNQWDLSELRSGKCWEMLNKT